jgi:hypothetical protein
LDARNTAPINCWLGIIVSRSAGGNLGFPEASALMLLGLVLGELAGWAVGMVGWGIGSVMLFDLFVVGVFAGPIIGAVVGAWLVLRSDGNAA